MLNQSSNGRENLGRGIPIYIDLMRTSWIAKLLQGGKALSASCGFRLSSWKGFLQMT
jgi:hypothetical protein